MIRAAFEEVEAIVSVFRRASHCIIANNRDQTIGAT